MNIKHDLTKLEWMAGMVAGATVKRDESGKPNLIAEDCVGVAEAILDCCAASDAANKAEVEAHSDR